MNMASSTSSTPSPNPIVNSNGSSGPPSAGASGQTSSGISGQQQQASGPNNPANDTPVSPERIACWITELLSSTTRENALMELSRKREKVVDLAVLLWHSFGSVAVLLHEVISVYPYITPPTLTAQQSNRVCNALALLQCIASHPETRSLFIQANIPLFLYPFLNTKSSTRPFEYLRLTSLGVIGALVKTDETEVINFLLTTEIIPLSLRIMQSGSELSKTVATFILQKILADDCGLNYICQTFDRFSHVAMVLGRMVLQQQKEASGRLLKHIIRCYLRLSDNARAREALRSCLPDCLKDHTFDAVLKEDQSTKKWLSQLLLNLEAPVVSNTQQASSSIVSQQTQSASPLGMG
jgi:CCR4-NOT transcription complex subunit 9